MKIVVAGTRGIPGIQGGVETHCEELYPRIASLGHTVTVIRRSCYLTERRKKHPVHTDAKGKKWQTYKGVRLLDVFAPRRKSIEAIFHTFLAVLQAKRLRPDVLHIHAIGPSLMVPLARMLGMKVVTTNHGPDYDRGKWGGLAKKVLRLGEKWGAKRSNEVIVISKVIADILASNYGRVDTHLIYNGVPEPSKSSRTDYIESLGLTPRRYVMALGRFVPEKNFQLLIRAWKASGLSEKGYRLVIAGAADHEDEFSRSLKREAIEEDVVLTGFIKGESLSQLLTHGSLFVLPSSHEGLPISLLEAMSYGLDVLVSDIPANKIAQLSSDDFFHLDVTSSAAEQSNITRLCEGLVRKLEARNVSRTYDLTPYNWDHIAQQTLQVYASLLD